MHKVRDVGPEGFVALHEIEGRSKALRLNRHPQRVDVVGRQFAAAPRVVKLAFEIVERDLADHRVDHVLDLAGQQDLALGIVFCPLQHAPERQHFAKDRGRLGQRQGGRGQHLALSRCKDLMHPMPQLVRERHDVARFAQVVEHDVGMHIRHRGMGKGTGGLARFHRGIDPALVEERLRDVGHARIEPGIGGHDRVARLVPADGAGVFHGQGRVAVPDLHAVQPQPFALQFVVAVRQARIGGDHGVAQGLDNLGFHVVRQVAAGLRGRHTAPAIKDFLFLGLGVVHAREDLDLVREHTRQFARRRFASAAVLVRQQVQRAFDVQVFAIDAKAQARNRFIEQPFPGVAHHAQIVKELFKFVRKLVRFHCANTPQRGTVARQIGAGR